MVIHRPETKTPSVNSVTYGVVLRIPQTLGDADEKCPLGSERYKLWFRKVQTQCWTKWVPDSTNLKVPDSTNLTEIFA